MIPMGQVLFSDFDNTICIKELPTILDLPQGVGSNLIDLFDVQSLKIWPKPDPWIKVLVDYTPLYF